MASQALSIAMPTQQVLPTLQIRAPIDDAETRRAAISENYTKSIGRTIMRRRADRTIEDITKEGGPFSAQEAESAEQFKENYCKNNQISSGAFDTLLHESQSQADPRKIWEEMYELFDYRPRSDLRKIIKRMFHPYGHRVGWTKEEDQELLDAVERFGKKWTKVGPAISRLPEAARDRWRNYLQYSDQNVKRDKWSDEELLQLGSTVGNLLQKVLADRIADAKQAGLSSDIALSDSECRKLIRWDAVARIVKSRTRLQCHQKWIDLEVAGQTSYLGELNEARKRLQMPQEVETTKSPDAAVLLAGDKLQLCKAIERSQAKSEGKLKWQYIRARSSKFSVFSEKLLRKAWRQMCKDHLTNEECISNKKGPSGTATMLKRRLKQVIPLADRKHYWARLGQAPDTTPQQPSIHRQLTLQHAAGKAQLKSSEYVEESDATDKE